VVDRADVLRARRVVEKHLVRTPTIGSRTLGARLKCELFQRTGSFKPRGAIVKLASLTEDEKQRGVITMSAGNHAQAVAFAAGEYGVDALIVMWQGASEQKLEATRSYGATVDLEATTPAEAFARVAELREHTGRTFIHPHEDPHVLAGAGTIALEVEEDAPDADALVVPVGGGGLIAGIASALGRVGSMRLIAVEAELSPALDAAIAAGKQVSVEPTSIADGLNVPIIGRPALELCRDLERVRVTEDEIATAFRFLYERAKLACEPAGAVAAAAILAGRIDARKAVAVVSGGNVSARTASDILASR
jgi:threonine dehydratase